MDHAAATAAFARLLTIMEELRAQCPWDKKQTWQTLSHLTVEETYELVQAIADGDAQELKKECGDVMLHLVFYAKIAQEQGLWDAATMIDALCDKLIARHPHIYGNVVAEDEEAVKRNWEQLKLAEQAKNGAAQAPPSVLAGVPRGLPAMVKAMRIQEKARGAGFDWDEPAQVWAKVREELDEFEQEAAGGANADAAEAEFGDVLFSLINYARFVGINPEQALERTNRKFIKRFTHLERRAAENNQTLTSMTLPEMDVYWEEAKRL